MNSTRVEISRFALLELLDHAMAIQEREIERAKPERFERGEIELERIRYFRRCIRGATADEIEAVEDGINPFPRPDDPRLLLN